MYGNMPRMTGSSGTYKRDPKDLLLRAQVYLMWRRRSLRFADQDEWENLTEAVKVMEVCLQKMERRESDRIEIKP